ncbi:MAG: hypothetical protein IJQ38_07905 [Bacteroidaceae bacterium]|nr:hypothetical protein [Bacteroidaceae bacterium]
MKKKYQQPASVAITLHSQLPLATSGSGYSVNSFTKGGEEELGGDTRTSSPVKANPVDWNE